MRFTITLVLFSVLFHISWSQKWPSVGVKWYYVSNNDMYSGESGINYYEIEKDTFFNEKECVYMNTGHILYTDTIKNVYIYSHINNRFNILYKFNSEIGDTIIMYDTSFGDSMVFVTNSIDTVLFKGIKRKKINFEIPLNWNWGSIIENIGSTFNMFPQWAAVDPCLCGPLKCYEDNTLGSYNILDDMPCYTDVENIEYNENNILVHPNPFNSYFEIETHSDKAYDVYVYNIFGNNLKKYSGISMEKIGFDLPPGTYIIKINDGHSIKTLKIIKI